MHEELLRDNKKLSEVRQRISQASLVNNKGFSSVKILSLSEGMAEYTGVIKPIIFGLGA